MLVKYLLALAFVAVVASVARADFRTGNLDVTNTLTAKTLIVSGDASFSNAPTVNGAPLITNTTTLGWIMGSSGGLSYLRPTNGNEGVIQDGDSRSVMKWSSATRRLWGANGYPAADFDDVLTVWASDGLSELPVHSTLTNHAALIQTMVTTNDARYLSAWQNPADAANWTWTSDGTNITLTGYTGPDAVVIPDMLDALPVTGFGRIFRESFVITNISGGANIKALASAAFDSSYTLISVSLPNVTTIGNSAFANCTALTSVSLPNATTLGTYAFSSCSALTSISLPNATTIGDDAFYACTSLTSVYFAQNAPAQATDVYLLTPNVTNYVTSPIATGWGTTWNGRPVVRMAVYSDSFVGNGAGLTNITAAQVGAATTSSVSFAAAPACYQITLTNTSALSWTNTWLPTSKVSRVTLTSTGTVTFVWNWPTQQDAGMRFALDRTGMPSVVFPAGAIYLTNGIYGTSAPVLGRSNYVSVIHDDNTYQIMVITNTLGTWGTP